MGVTRQRGCVRLCCFETFNLLLATLETCAACLVVEEDAGSSATADEAFPPSVEDGRFPATADEPFHPLAVNPGSFVLEFFSIILFFYHFLDFRYTVSFLFIPAVL